MTPLEEVLTELKIISQRLTEMNESNKLRVNEESYKLRRRRKELIEKMISWGMSRNEIAREVGLSRQRISQILDVVRGNHRDNPGELV